MKLEVGAVYRTREGSGARVTSKKGLAEHPFNVLHTPMVQRLAKSDPSRPRFFLWHRVDGTVGAGIAEVNGVQESDPSILGKKYDLVRLLTRGNKS